MCEVDGVTEYEIIDLIQEYIRDKKAELSSELSQALICKDKAKEDAVEKCMDMLDDIEAFL